MIRRVGANRYRVVARVRVAGVIQHAQDTIDGTAEEAKRRFEELKAGLRQRDGSLPIRPKAPRTFANLCEGYRTAARERPLSRSRLRMLRTMQTALGLLPLPQVPGALQRWMGEQRAEGHEMLVTVGTKLVRAVYNCAVSDGILTTNPIGRRFKTAPCRVRDRVLTAVEEAALVNACEQEAPHLLPLVQYALAVPIRIGEALALRVSDVDLLNRRLIVRNETAKNGRGSVKPVTADLAEHMGTLTGEVVFPDAKGCRQYRISEDWLRVVAAAKLKDVRFHTLRHCAVTRMVNKGLPAAHIAAIAGWGSTTMLATYHTRSAVDAADAALKLYCDSACDSVSAKSGQNSAKTAS